MFTLHVGEVKGHVCMLRLKLKVKMASVDQIDAQKLSRVEKVSSVELARDKKQPAYRKYNKGHHKNELSGAESIRVQHLAYYFCQLDLDSETERKSKDKPITRRQRRKKKKRNVQSQYITLNPGYPIKKWRPFRNLHRFSKLQHED